MTTSTLFDNAFFVGNREKLLKQIPSSPLIVLTAYGQMQRRADSAFKFEQEANFWYLTGIDEPDWWLIIDGRSAKTWLVCPEIDATRRVFDGDLSNEDALKISGAGTVIDKTEARRLLTTLRQQHPIAYTLLPDGLGERHGFYANPAHRRLVKELGKFQIRNCRNDLNKLRAIKQPKELEVLRSAIDISITGIKAAMQELPKYEYEYQFEAKLSQEFRTLGAEGHAYDPIVAVGESACTLHYHKNNSKLSKKEWLLFDVGARFDHYCADITRTIPLGEPSKRSIAIYEAVHEVHDRAIALCKPGQPTQDYIQEVDKVMLEALKRLKLARAGDEKALRKYFPHAISHGLGIDVHDSLGGPTEFAEGMVLTVEPGIYVPEEGIGIRIEDDIYIAKDGPVNLSGALPVELDELRALIGK